MVAKPGIDAASALSFSSCPGQWASNTWQHWFMLFSALCTGVLTTTEVCRPSNGPVWSLAALHQRHTSFLLVGGPGLRFQLASTATGVTGSWCPAFVARRWCPGSIDYRTSQSGIRIVFGISKIVLSELQVLSFELGTTHWPKEGTTDARQCHVKKKTAIII